MASRNTNFSKEETYQILDIWSEPEIQKSFEKSKRHAEI